MKPDIHPEYKEVKVVCSCGSSFVTRSTLDKDQISLEVCAKCHPFYTGTQKIVDTAGRVDRFRQKYGMKGKEETKAPKVETKATKEETKAPKVETKATKEETKATKEETKATKEDKKSDKTEK